MKDSDVLMWVLIVLGVMILVARSLFGHRVALLLIGIWVIVAMLGWATGIGVRR